MNKQRLKTSAGKVALVHRDVRFTDVLSPYAYPRGEISGAFVFATSVFRRHSYNRVRYWQRLQRIFRLLRYVQNTFNNYRHFLVSVNRCFASRLDIRPALILKQISRAETSPVYLANIQVQNIKNNVQSNDRAHKVAAFRESRKGLRMTYAERLVQRVVKRGVRIEENVLHRNAQRALVSLKTEYIKPAAPVPRRVMGSGSEMSSEPSVPKQHHNDAPEPLSQSIMRLKHEDSERTTPVNIEQLTHQVVRAIDRRIIAQRERMGKI